MTSMPPRCSTARRGAQRYSSTADVEPHDVHTDPPNVSVIVRRLLQDQDTAALADMTGIIIFAETPPLADGGWDREWAVLCSSSSACRRELCWSSCGCVATERNLLFLFFVVSGRRPWCHCRCHGSRNSCCCRLLLWWWWWCGGVGA